MIVAADGSASVLDVYDTEVTITDLVSEDTVVTDVAGDGERIVTSGRITFGQRKVTIGG